MGGREGWVLAVERKSPRARKEGLAHRLALDLGTIVLEWGRTDTEMEP